MVLTSASHVVLNFSFLHHQARSLSKLILGSLLNDKQVLWPECGWEPVSLTDMITSASVKKVYRKATLYIHPDKVQQKGATLQQKYTAEKVFDILKVALSISKPYRSNEFNSKLACYFFVLWVVFFLSFSIYLFFLILLL